MATVKNPMSIRRNSTKGTESVHWLDEGFDDVSDRSEARLHRIQLLTLSFAPFVVTILFALGFELALTIVVFLTLISIESFVFRPFDLHEYPLNSWTGNPEVCTGPIWYVNQERVGQAEDDDFVIVPYLYVLLSRFKRKNTRISTI